MVFTGLSERDTLRYKSGSSPLRGQVGALSGLLEAKEKYQKLGTKSWFCWWAMRDSNPRPLVPENEKVNICSINPNMQFHFYPLF